MNEMQIVVFRLDREEYGIDIGRVREIVRVREEDISRLPGAAKHIEGMTNLRGVVVPVVDIKRIFFPDGGVVISDEQDKKDGHRRMIVVSMDGADAGILVSSVTEILRVNGSDIEQPPSMLRSGSGRGDAVSGVAKVGERLIVVLDLDTLFETALPETNRARPEESDARPAKTYGKTGETERNEEPESKTEPGPESPESGKNSKTASCKPDKSSVLKTSEKNGAGKGKKDRTVRIRSFPSDSDVEGLVSDKAGSGEKPSGEKK